MDPDTSGAIAVVSWTTPSLDVPVDLASLDVKLYDMPCLIVKLNRRSERTGEQVIRRCGQRVGARGHRGRNTEVRAAGRGTGAGAVDAHGGRRTGTRVPATGRGTGA